MARPANDNINRQIKTLSFLPNKLALKILNRKLAKKSLKPLSYWAYKRRKSRLCPYDSSRKYSMLRCRGIGAFIKRVRAAMAEAGWKSMKKRNYDGGKIVFTRYIKEGHKYRRFWATFRVNRNLETYPLGTLPFRLFITERVGRRWEQKSKLVGWQQSIYWRKLIEYSGGYAEDRARPKVQEYWKKYCYYKELPGFYGVLNERVVKANRLIALYESRYF